MIGQSFWRTKNLAYYPTSHASTPGQRQRMIDILQPAQRVGAMDGNTEAMVTQRNLLATLISMRR